MKLLVLFLLAFCFCHFHFERDFFQAKERNKVNAYQGSSWERTYGTEGRAYGDRNVKEVTRHGAGSHR